MSKTAQNQAKPTESIRQRIIKSSIPLTKISKISGIPYFRLRRIVNEKTEPTFDEGNLLTNTLNDMISAVQIS